MNRILKHIFYTITSGRPMTLTNDAGFLDIVCGKIVNNYTDYFGREWMAHGKWSSFRVANIKGESLW